MIENYKNKLFSILGDSISTFEGYSEPYDAGFYDAIRKCQSDILRCQQTWWGQVIDYLGGELLVNNSISGSMVTKHKSCIVESYGCSDMRTSILHKDEIQPDIIMVYLGTNDWGHGVKLYPNNGEQNDISIFSVAYEGMIKKLKNNYPNAEIWCLTLAVSDTKKAKGVDFPYCYGGVHMEKYCDIIRNCAKNFDCRIIDLYNYCTPFDTIDGFHPNLDGMYTIGNTVIKILEEN